MIKAYAFLKRRPDVSAADFHVHWATVHREHALAIERIRRYVQAHVIDEPVPGLPPAPLDGIPEVWMDDLQSAATLREDPAHRTGAFVDEPLFIDMSVFAGMRTVPRLVLEAQRPEREPWAVKVLVLLRAAHGRAPFAAELPARTLAAAKATGAFRALCAEAIADRDEQPYADGVAELWFKDLDAFRAGWGDGARARGHFNGGDDGAADLARSTAVLVRELRALYPGEFAEPVDAPA